MTDRPIPIGTPVRFKPANGSRPWQGVLTSYLSDTQVQCDNAGSIPLVMLEPLPDEIARLQAEIAALREVIAMQCDLIATKSPVSEIDKKYLDRLDEVETGFDDLREAVAAMLFDRFGTSKPAPSDIKDLGLGMTHLVDQMGRWV